MCCDQQPTTAVATAIVEDKDRRPIPLPDELRRGRKGWAALPADKRPTLPKPGLEIPGVTDREVF